MRKSKKSTKKKVKSTAQSRTIQLVIIVIVFLLICGGCVCIVVAYKRFMKASKVKMQKALEENDDEYL